MGIHRHQWFIAGAIVVAVAGLTATACFGWQGAGHVLFEKQATYSAAQQTHDAIVLDRFDHPATKTPKPTSTAKPTKTPKPTHTVKPTKTPKPTRTPARKGDEFPCSTARSITWVLVHEHPDWLSQIERDYPGILP